MKSTAQQATMNPATTITGQVQSVTRAFNGGWRRVVLSNRQVVVGVMPDDIRPGDEVICIGRTRSHPQYGDQFQADSVTVKEDRSTQGLIRYLDLHFKWIGPFLAGQIVKRFGDELFDVIENHPERLSEVKGITRDRAQEMHEEYQRIKADREHDRFFADHHITRGVQGRLVEAYGSKAEAVEAVKDDPYTLSDMVWGVGFKTADAIAQTLTVSPESPSRIRAALRYILQEQSESLGHCFLPVQELARCAQELTGVDSSLIWQGIKSGIADERLIDHSGEIYHPDFFRAEREVAEKLRSLASSHHEIMIQELSRQEIAEMDQDQLAALMMACKSKICVITGGPGTGKTYTIKRILSALGNASIALAAPTGKAAKRMSEMTGRPASTIHRLLAYDPFQGRFTQNRDNPLECETLIIDETSMIDIRLMCSLMDAVTIRTQVIFVGDVDQLPSVGPGRVLADMIESGVIPVARLSTLHRQAAESLINTNARAINHGAKLHVRNAKGDDLWFIPEEDPQEIAGSIRKLIGIIPDQFGFGLQDIQVLCPQKRGPIGTKELNEALRLLLNPDGRKLPGVPYMAGDRVIQMKNNYKVGVFNGDIMNVKDVDPAGNYLVMDLDGQTLDYPTCKIEELQLAYALTIHKSQGSEFPVVIIPVHATNFIMLKRNLIYTAITRGKRLVFVVGSMKAVNIAIRTVDSSRRYSNLNQRIRGERCQAQTSEPSP